MTQQEFSGAHILATHESAPFVLAVGFCASCCAPLREEQLLRMDVDGEQLMFCSERCTGTYEKRDLFHW